MKTKYIYSVFTVFIMLITFTSCIKDGCYVKLPPATQKGANTFGCKINGVIHESRGHLDYGVLLIFPGVRADIYEKTANIAVLFRKPPAILQTYGFEFEFDKKEGVYRKFICRVNEKITGDSYVKITYYSSNIISGEFQIFERYNTGEELNITEGRFDIKLDN